ncbi:MAG: lysine--tRNA ligase [Deltaproteobacteria bacterium]|nr:lysine--tRNA ligase [Deltaproteobacteria bacterium]
MDELHHWADVAAARTLQAHPQRDSITVAAGITPSGVVHIGNFREVMTVDLVARALRDRGVKVRFLYSWDDFDVFRKVPADAPAAESLQQQLGRSIADVPDPWGEHDSYASHHIASFEQSLEPLGIRPEFIRQSRAYRAGRYAEGVRAALQHAGTIRGILNAARERNGARSLLPDTWLPLAGFCRACGFDDLDFAWDGEWTVQVHCKHDGCGSDHAVDLRQGGDLKLPWRVDWPMRWGFEQVCFEPGGKDHSSAGGSYDTAKDIVREVYGWVAPQYVGYDFVTLKGAAGKISSSKGGVVTVADCLEVYEPEVLRWMFASYRPNTEFQISFDLDVIKLYEDYDRCVRLANESDDGSSRTRSGRPPGARSSSPASITVGSWRAARCRAWCRSDTSAWSCRSSTATSTARSRSCAASVRCPTTKAPLRGPAYGPSGRGDGSATTPPRTSATASAPRQSARRSTPRRKPCLRVWSSCCAASRLRRWRPRSPSSSSVGRAKASISRGSTRWSTGCCWRANRARS